MTDSTNSASDIVRDHWTIRMAAPPMRPYIRLARIDRPIGTWLLLLPCWWGVALATSAEPGWRWPDPVFFILFAIGALVMRGAGCCWNDIADRDFDGRVARTALRPIPAGEISVRQAVAFMGFLALIGLAVLLTFNGYTVWLSMASLVLVFIYPLMKRVTYWPQIFLGLAFNWGVLVGWTAVAGSLSTPPLLMYAAGIAWTLGYDTIYAHQDKEDDALIGLKSTALKFGDNTRPWLWCFYTATIALLGAAGWDAGLDWPYFAALALGAAQLAWQAAKIDIDSPPDCLSKFRSNRYFGLILLAGMIAG
ncbi:MAG: 4-hydroxybenzoate octaprenyltransferase [Alphaproteobacteria bacterium]